MATLLRRASEKCARSKAAPASTFAKDFARIIIESGKGNFHHKEEGQRSSLFLSCQNFVAIKIALDKMLKNGDDKMENFKREGLFNETVNIMFTHFVDITHAARRLLGS